MTEQIPRRRNRKRHVHDDVAAAIRLLVLQSKPPAAIWHELVNSESFDGMTIPSIHTIRRMKKDIEQEDQTGTWDWTKDDADVIRLVLDTLREVNIQTQGRIQTFTKLQAERIYTIRSAFPDINPMYAYMIAATMTGNTGGSDRIDNVTGFLMYQPWQDDNGQKQYWNAIKQGWVPKGPPLALSMGPDGDVTVTTGTTAIKLFIDAIHSPYMPEEESSTISDRDDSL